MERFLLCIKVLFTTNYTAVYSNGGIQLLLQYVS
jgi:hypothetical protein